MTEVRFARSGDVDVAYRAVGDGPIDLVCVEGAYTHLEIAWELPAYRRYYRVWRSTSTSGTSPRRSTCPL